MHAMCPPQLTTAILTPRRIFRNLPLGPYQPLHAASAAALDSLAPVATDAHLPVCHVTPLHPEPLPPARPSTDAAASTLARSTILPAAQHGESVAALTPAALHILQLPGEPSSAAISAAAPEILARLPLRVVCSSAADGAWLEVVYTAPAGLANGRDDIVHPPAEHDVRAVAGGDAGSTDSTGSTKDAVAYPAIEGARAAKRAQHAADADEEAAPNKAEPGALLRAAGNEAEGPAQGSGLPFRVLRVRCDSAAGAARLHAAVAAQLLARVDALRRRAPLVPPAAAACEE